MRLWHKDLVKLLPKRQLLGQWRECCLIAKNIAEIGTPNHILVNKIMDYPLEYFEGYTKLIYLEMQRRGYKPDENKFYQYFPEIKPQVIMYTELYQDWHNFRYLAQCYFNLQEKYDCGGISDDEWKPIDDFMMNTCSNYSK